MVEEVIGGRLIVKYQRLMALVDSGHVLMSPPPPAPPPPPPPPPVVMVPVSPWYFIVSQQGNAGVGDVRFVHAVRGLHHQAHPCCRGPPNKARVSGGLEDQEAW